MNNNILIWRQRQRRIRRWRERWRRRCRRKPSVFSSREHKTPQLLKGVEFAILVDPFGQEGQEVPPPLSPEPWWDGRLASCQDVNTRYLTSWRVSAGTMEIMALPDSTSDRIFSPLPSLFTVCDDNITAEMFFRLSNHEVEESVS